MFKEYWIELDTIDGAKQLNAIALSYEEDIDIIKGRYVIDAKSILGIFSLDISKPVKIKIHSEQSHEQNQSHSQNTKLQKYLRRKPQ